MMLPESNPCKYCGGKPRVATVPGDLHYAQCKCGNWNPYEFIGSTPRGAIENWNTYNPKRNNNGRKSRD